MVRIQLLASETMHLELSTHRRRVWMYRHWTNHGQIMDSGRSRHRSVLTAAALLWPLRTRATASLARRLLLQSCRLRRGAAQPADRTAPPRDACAQPPWLAAWAPASPRTSGSAAMGRLPMLASPPRSPPILAAAQPLSLINQSRGAAATIATSAPAHQAVACAARAAMLCIASSACMNYFLRDQPVFLHRSRSPSSPPDGATRSKPRCKYVARSRRTKTIPRRVPTPPNLRAMSMCLA